MGPHSMSVPSTPSLGFGTSSPQVRGRWRGHRCSLLSWGEATSRGFPSPEPALVSLLQAPARRRLHWPGKHREINPIAGRRRREAKSRSPRRKLSRRHPAPLTRAGRLQLPLGLPWVGYEGPAQPEYSHPSPPIACPLQSCPVCPQAGGERGAVTTPGSPGGRSRSHPRTVCTPCFSPEHSRPLPGKRHVPSGASPRSPWHAPRGPLPAAPFSSQGKDWRSLAEDYVKNLQLRRDKLFLKIARSGRAGQPLPPVAGCLHGICLVKGQIKELATTCRSLPVYLFQALSGSQAPASTFIFKYWPDLFPEITGLSARGWGGLYCAESRPWGPPSSFPRTQHSRASRRGGSFICLLMGFSHAGSGP